MKLPDFTDHPGLKSLRRAMEATAPGGFTITYRPNALTQEELNELAGEGIEVFFEEITKLNDGTLGYKESRVLVYIRDVPSYGGDFNLPRFHFAFCSTLEKMHANHRFERYVVANREDGQFLIQRIIHRRKANKTWEKLIVCQNCLNALQFDNFSYSLPKKSRTKIVSSFSIPRFFERYPRSLHLKVPQNDYISAPTNDYPEGFDEISRSIKRARNYKCEECGLKPEDRFVHVHHVNGQKNDNRRENLRVLCLGCHAAMPQHGHMKRMAGFEEFQRKYNLTP
jgi:hypothetical protein